MYDITTATNPKVIWWRNCNKLKQYTCYLLFMLISLNLFWVLLHLWTNWKYQQWIESPSGSDSSNITTQQLISGWQSYKENCLPVWAEPLEVQIISCNPSAHLSISRCNRCNASHTSNKPEMSCLSLCHLSCQPVTEQAEMSGFVTERVMLQWWTLQTSAMESEGLWLHLVAKVWAEWKCSSWQWCEINQM